MARYDKNLSMKNMNTLGMIKLQMFFMCGKYKYEKYEHSRCDNSI